LEINRKEGKVGSSFLAIIVDPDPWFPHLEKTATDYVHTAGTDSKVSTWEALFIACGSL
jgi:hypothetical protein